MDDQSRPDHPHVDLDQLRTALLDRLESLAEDLLGSRNKERSTSGRWRWGKQGSLLLEMRGRKRGTWFSHEDGVGGGPLDLICHAKGIPIADAIQWGAKFAGIAPTTKTDHAKDRRKATARATEARRRQASDEAEEAADRQRRIARAQCVWHQTVPGPDMVADRYLRETRGIAIAAWPDAVRFLPVRTVTLPEQPTDAPDITRTLPTAGALVLAATAADGTLQAIQRVYLTDDADNLRGADGGKIKLTLGVLSRAAVRLPGPPEGPLLIAEGPETGLSVWHATGHETWIALGNAGSVGLPRGRRVVVCRDDDRPHSPADKALGRALAKWDAAGCAVAVATPWPTRRGDKSDFNDTIRIAGADAVRERIADALHPQGRVPVRVAIEEGRHKLAKAVTGFFRAAALWNADRDAKLVEAPSERPPPPLDAWGRADEDEPSSEPPQPPKTAQGSAPVHLVQIDVGGGKSTTARALAAKTLADMRACGDQRAIAIAVPTHQLGAEQQLAFEALPEVQAAGLSCRSWRGRRADDPDAPGKTMCRNLPLMREVQALKLDVEKRACGICPHKPSCAYLGQRKQRADLWFVPHQMIYEAKPKALGDLAALIVDENPIGAGLEGVERQHGSQRALHLPFDALARVDQIEGSGGSIATDRLTFLRRAAMEILGGCIDGPVRRAVFDFDGANVSASSAREARALEWRTRVDVELTAEMSAEDRAVALEGAARNADLGLRKMFWTALEALLDDGPEASGWLAIGGGGLKVEHVARHAELKGRRGIGKKWCVPTLILDATAKSELLRFLWPQLQVTTDVRITAPHQRVRQTTDAGYALSRLDVDNAKTDEERRHRQRNLRNLYALICREARQYVPGIVLVVAQKRIERVLLGLGHLPRNIRLEHHNAVRGRDEYHDARALIVVGRTMPPSSTVARLLEALTGAAAPSASYEQAGAVRELADGTMLACEALRYPDVTGEILRWQACEAEVVQIIGRGRGVNRTKDTPLDVLVLTDVPLPMPVQPIASADLAPSPDDLMAAAGAIVFENPGHAAAAYPGVWANRNTAKTAMRRGKLGSNPYKDSTSYTGLNPTSVWSRVEYQRAGQGQTSAVAWFDRNLISEPEASLAALLGPIAWVRMSSVAPIKVQLSTATQTMARRPSYPAAFLISAPRRFIRGARS